MAKASSIADNPREPSLLIVIILISPAAGLPPPVEVAAENHDAQTTSGAPTFYVRGRAARTAFFRPPEHSLSKAAPRRFEESGRGLFNFFVRPRRISCARF